MTTLFPNEDNKCACGCGKELSGRRTRWASDQCQKIPSIIYGILRGELRTIYRIVAHRDGEVCRECGKTAAELYELDDRKLNYNNPLELDHIVPVHKGGGGMWLDNYQILCYKCHRDKTKGDAKKPKNP